jgi:hypothetical protein
MFGGQLINYTLNKPNQPNKLKQPNEPINPTNNERILKPGKAGVSGLDV